MFCIWCEQEEAKKTTKDCTWIDPTGKDVIVVTQVPAISCPVCNDVYLEDKINEEIEAALSTVELEKLGERFSYAELMNAPKVSIFDLYKKSK